MRSWICIFYMLSFNTCVVFCYYVGTHVTKAILNNCLTYIYLLYIHRPLTQKALKTKLTWNTCNLSSLCYLFTSWKWVDIFSFNFWQISFNYPTQLANSKDFQKPSYQEINANISFFSLLSFSFMKISGSIWVFLASCLVFTKKKNPSITPPM